MTSAKSGLTSLHTLILLPTNQNRQTQHLSSSIHSHGVDNKRSTTLCRWTLSPDINDNWSCHIFSGQEQAYSRRNHCCSCDGCRAYATSLGCLFLLACFILRYRNYCDKGMSTRKALLCLISSVLSPASIFSHERTYMSEHVSNIKLSNFHLRRQVLIIGRN